MTREEEQTIIAKAQRGDTDAFEKLVTENERLVYNVALRLMGDEQDAQDAAQEAFIKAYTSLGSFRCDSKFSVWLYRLTNNVCIDMLRKRRGVSVSLSTENGDGEESQLDIPDERFSPEAVLEKKELNRAVSDGLAMLSEEYRQILVLREVAGQSYDEIALTLSLDIGTVKSRIFRARKKLCSILTADGNIFGKNPSDMPKGGVQA